MTKRADDKQTAGQVSGSNLLDASIETPTEVGKKSTPQLEMEAAKILLSSSMDFIRGTTQLLQAFSSLLVTAYIALLIAVRKGEGFPDSQSLFLAILPLALWVTSLAAGYAQAVSYRGSEFVVDEGNPVDALETYDKVVRDRRRHLFLPSILTLAGIVFFVISLFLVLLPHAR